MDTPVLVVGAGPVGLATALLLARWQVPSIVLEASSRPDSVGSRAICFQRDVLEIFDRIGCAEPMVAEGVTWTTGRTYYRDHELFSVSFPAPETGALPPWINISQASVENYLRRRVADEPLIDIRYGYVVTGLRQYADRVEADADGPGSPVTLAGSHLVGADGPRSAVRKLLGIGFPGQSFADQFLIADIRADLPFPSERRFHFDPKWNPGRQVLVHHCPDSTWRIDWQVPADFDLAAERRSGALDARIRKIAGDRSYEIVWLSAYRFHERVAESFQSGRVFLAGDAAHLFAPFGARGLNSGIQDAENIAWKIGFVRRGWAGPWLLDSYTLERRAAALENLRVTRATMEFLVPQTPEQARHRRTVLERAITDASARAAIDSGKLAEPFCYATSPLTTPGTVGAGVLCPDGPCRAAGVLTRLRRLLGHGFVVLTERPAELPVPAGFPVRHYALSGIDVDGALRRALHATDQSVHLIRPDGHLAAVLPRPDPGALAAALSRAVGEYQAASGSRSPGHRKAGSGRRHSLAGGDHT
jgi:2-polyprenyl-6-methoxyphenol hydroxylase-like FAD-dependent oxidoreductase